MVKNREREERERERERESIRFLVYFSRYQLSCNIINCTTLLVKGQNLPEKDTIMVSGHQAISCNCTMREPAK